MSLPLPDRFRRHVQKGGWLAVGDRVVVAFSGGLDSSVLLHLLRFTPGLPAVELHAAHFDHRMREGSGGDLLRCRGVAGAWGVRFHGSPAPRPATDEEDARELRYGFLEDVAREVDARWIVTAHHADDQAETVLFRLLRGTGPTGLGGIHEVRPPGILRPLLPFRRDELEVYANRVRLRASEDPTNRRPDVARNVLRHEILPALEARVAPGARRALVRLAELERSRERAVAALVRSWLDGAGVEERGSEVVLPRRPLLELGPEAGAEVVRSLLGKRGVVPGRSGTEEVMEFITTGSSGRTLQLAEGLSLAREFDRFVLRPSVVRADATGEPSNVVVEGEEGHAVLTLGGRRLQVRWSRRRDPGGGGTGVKVRSPSAGATLRVRGWIPGDRIRLPAGSKKLKKLFVERRVPRSERNRIPVLAESDQAVVWIPGIAISPEARPRAGEDPLYVRVGDGGTD